MQRIKKIYYNYHPDLTDLFFIFFIKNVVNFDLFSVNILG